MTGYLTTHVLDTSRGCPAEGLTVELFRVDGPDREPLARMTTNADGRTNAPILPQGRFAPGAYELLFHAGPYLARHATADQLPFLDLVPIRFVMAQPAHFHVPLLLSPYGYATYRGS